MTFACFLKSNHRKNPVNFSSWKKSSERINDIQEILYLLSSDVFIIFVGP